MEKEEKQKDFCYNCRDDVEYIVKTCDKVGKVRGKEYKYIGKDILCANCGSFLFVDSIIDGNLEALYDAYRKENENAIITID